MGSGLAALGLWADFPAYSPVYCLLPIVYFLLQVRVTVKSGTIDV